ncbi:MAG TPA: hypothetical protein VF148_05880 [Acidimicrobiia bacterium]
MVHVPPSDGEPGLQARRSTAWWAIALFVIAAALLVLQTRPLAPAFEWSSIGPPPGPLNFDSIVALDDGVALLSGVTSRGVLLWWWDPSGTWQSQELEDAPTQLAEAGDRLIAYRSRTGAIWGRIGGGWSPIRDLDLPAATRARRASGRPSVLSASDGLLVFSVTGDVWWLNATEEPARVVESPAWGHGVERPFTSACRPPSRSSPDVPPLVVTDDRMLAMTSSNLDEPFGIWPVCEPVTWTSENGREWSMATTTLSSGGVYVYDLAWRNGTLVAVGGRGIGRPSVWSSENGVDWVDITPSMPEAVDLYRIAASPAGWVILGRDSLESRPVGWTSTDATCWDRLPDPVRGGDAVVSEDHILVMDRTGLPGMWLASPTGSRGACR